MGEFVLAPASSAVTVEVTSIAKTILRHVIGIGSVMGGVREADREAVNLLAKVQQIEPTMRDIRDRHTLLSHCDAMYQLEYTVHEVKFTLQQYAESSKGSRAWNRNSNCAKFSRLSRKVTDGMNAVMLHAIVAQAPDKANDLLDKKREGDCVFC